MQHATWLTRDALQMQRHGASGARDHASTAWHARRRGGSQMCRMMELPACCSPATELKTAPRSANRKAACRRHREQGGRGQRPTQGRESRTSPAPFLMSRARIRCERSQPRAMAGSRARSRSMPSPLFNRLNASSTCQRSRYAARASAAIALSAGNEVRPSGTGPTRASSAAAPWPTVSCCVGAPLHGRHGATSEKLSNAGEPGPGRCRTEAQRIRAMSQRQSE